MDDLKFKYPITGHLSLHHVKDVKLTRRAGMLNLEVEGLNERSSCSITFFGGEDLAPTFSIGEMEDPKNRQDLTATRRVSMATEKDD